MPTIVLTPRDGIFTINPNLWQDVAAGVTIYSNYALTTVAYQDGLFTDVWGDSDVVDQDGNTVFACEGNYRYQFCGPICPLFIDEDDYDRGDYNEWEQFFTISTTVPQTPTIDVTLKSFDLTYNGQGKQLVAGYSCTGGVARFGVSSSNTTVPTDWYFPEYNTNLCPADAGTYYVWYKVIGNSGYSNIGPTYKGAVTITQRTQTVSFSDLASATKVNSTSISATTNTSFTFTVSSQYGDPVYISGLSATYATVSPTSSASSTKASGSTFTITTKGNTTNSTSFYIKTPGSTNNKSGSALITLKIVSGLSTPSVSITLKSGLTYNGGQQELINSASCTGGTLYFGQSVSSSIEPTSWSIAKSDITYDINTCYVWYKVTGNTGYSNISPTVKGAVTIGQATPTPTFSYVYPMFTYNGSAQKILSSVTVPTGCSIIFKLDSQNAMAPTDAQMTNSVDAAAAKITNAGTYYIWYKITGDGTYYKNVATKVHSSTITMGKAAQTVTGLPASSAAEPLQCTKGSSLAISLSSEVNDFLFSLTSPATNYASLGTSTTTSTTLYFNDETSDAQWLWIQVNGNSNYSSTNLYLYFEIIEAPTYYTVSFFKSQNGTVLYQSTQSYVANSSYSAPTPAVTPSGYTFAGWAKDNENSSTVNWNGSGTKIVTANVEWYPVWSKDNGTRTTTSQDTYYMTFNPVSGTSFQKSAGRTNHYNYIDVTVYYNSVLGNPTTSSTGGTLDTTTFTYDAMELPSSYTSTTTTTFSGTTAYFNGWTMTSTSSTPDWSSGTWDPDEVAVWTWYGTWKNTSGTHDSVSSSTLTHKFYSVSDTVYDTKTTTKTVTTSYTGDTVRYSYTGLSTNARDGVASGSSTTYGTLSTPTNPTYSGYVWSGWTDGSSKTSSVTVTSKPTTSTNWYGTWSKAGSISYTTDHGTAPSNTSFTRYFNYKRNTGGQISVTLAAAIIDAVGYTFGGWAIGSNTYNGGGTFTDTSTSVALTATAIWDTKGVWIQTASGWKKSTPYIWNGTIWVPVTGAYVWNGTIWVPAQ